MDAIIAVILVLGFVARCVVEFKKSCREQDARQAIESQQAAALDQSTEAEQDGFVLGVLLGGDLFDSEQ